MLTNLYTAEEVHEKMCALDTEIRRMLSEVQGELKEEIRQEIESFNKIIARETAKMLEGAVVPLVKSDDEMKVAIMITYAWMIGLSIGVVYIAIRLGWALG